MLAGSRELGADQVMLDLEDSVAPNAKDEARERVLAELERGGWGERIVSVRVNPLSSDAGRRDLDALARSGAALETVVVPKVSSPEDLRVVEEMLGDRSDVGLEALIETATGLAAAEAIASASGRLRALVFGPLDLGASLGIPAFAGDGTEGYPGDLWHYARFRILVAARAAGVLVIDGPLPLLDDPERLHAAAVLAASIGFDGKWVIHPRQIDIVNEAFTPTRASFDGALAVIRALDQTAEREGRGAVGLGDLMVDEASRRMAEGIVARGRAAGLRD